MMGNCYLCGKPGEQMCIVCGRDICQKEIAQGLYPGDWVIDRECDKITPNREQAERHFMLREEIRLKVQKEHEKGYYFTTDGKLLHPAAYVDWFNGHLEQINQERASSHMKPCKPLEMRDGWVTEGPA